MYLNYPKFMTSGCQGYGGYVYYIFQLVPICSMHGIFTYIYPKNGPNGGKYSIHGAYGVWGLGLLKTQPITQAFSPRPHPENRWCFSWPLTGRRRLFSRFQRHGASVSADVISFTGAIQCCETLGGNVGPHHWWNMVGFLREENRNLMGIYQPVI